MHCFELYAGKGMTDYMEPLYPGGGARISQQAYIEQMYRFYGYGMDRATGIPESLISAPAWNTGRRAESWMNGLCDRYAVAETGLCDGVYAVRFLPVKGELMLPSVGCLIEEERSIEHLAQSWAFITVKRQ